MKKLIFTSAILLVFLYGIMSLNYSGKDTVESQPIETTSKIIEEKSIAEPTSVKKAENANLSRSRKKVTDNTLKNSKPKSKNKVKKISKKKLDNSDPYADALDKKIERDIKEISANYPEKPPGIKDEIDNEIINSLNDPEELADNDYEEIAYNDY